MFEDEAKVASFIAHGFEQEGHAVDVVHDGESGLLQATQLHFSSMVVVSASGEEIVEPIARALGATHAMATRMVVVDGKYTGEIEFYCYGEGKAAAIRELAALEGPGLQTPDTRPATKEELFGFLDHLEGELDAAGFFKTADKKPGMLRNIRNLFSRAALTEQEVRSLRGIVASLTRDHLKRKGGGE